MDNMKPENLEKAVALAAELSQIEDGLCMINEGVTFILDTKNSFNEGRTYAVPKELQIGMQQAAVAALEGKRKTIIDEIKTL